MDIRPQNRKGIEVKTKKEIIDETAAAYTLRTRATSDCGCLYLTEDGSGRMCAVGRCLADPEEFSRNYRGVFAGTLGDQLDKHLRPEYQGHPALFWADLQYLHDNDGYWDEHGLSGAGRLAVAELRIKWV